MEILSRPLTSVLGALVVVAVALLPPAAAAPVPGPVGLDQACAAELARRLGPVDVLGCDPRGRGLAVLAIGDPATSDHVVVLVPGSDTDLRTLHDPADPQRRPLGWARSLAGAGGPDLAIVLWVGYPTPLGVGVDAATGRLARAGAAALVPFVEELEDGGAHVTVVGHSYGAVVAALAAPELPADDLVLLGSPGARAASVADLRTGARVWAARTAGDWVGRVPSVQLGDLGHGADPAGAAFGARALPVAGTSGHDGYFRPGSAALAGVVAVCLGRTPDAAAPVEAAAR
ncbi:alpha/beta hydrolase [Modestobacter sp. SYSU DS0511]